RCDPLTGSASKKQRPHTRGTRRGRSIDYRKVNGRRQKRSNYHMGRRKKKVPRQCVYCGALATTRDHVPPANLFFTKPCNLITVPSCERCNRDASPDDENLRLA